MQVSHTPSTKRPVSDDPSGIDVIGFLKAQHQQIKDLFDLVLAARGKEREKAFYGLRRLLAVHETAEEEVLHPIARRTVPNGPAIIQARLREENAAKKVLAKIEALDVASPLFESELRGLRQRVLAHAEAEEREEFDRLAKELDRGKLMSMRTVVEFAEAVAPTRPHAGFESATANILAGPFASIIDRARDALTGKN